VVSGESSIVVIVIDCYELRYSAMGMGKLNFSSKSG